MKNSTKHDRRPGESSNRYLLRKNLIAASLVSRRNYLVRITGEVYQLAVKNINKAASVLNTQKKWLILGVKDYPFQMVANLLSLRTTLASRQTMQAL